MPRITISYRRDDSGVITGRIFDRCWSRVMVETQFSATWKTFLSARRRAMDRKLRGLEVLPEIEAATILELDQVEDTEGNHEERAAAE